MVVAVLAVGRFTMFSVGVRPPLRPQSITITPVNMHQDFQPTRAMAQAYQTTACTNRMKCHHLRPWEAVPHPSFIIARVIQLVVVVVGAPPFPPRASALAVLLSHQQTTNPKPRQGHHMSSPTSWEQFAPQPGSSYPLRSSPSQQHLRLLQPRRRNQATLCHP